MHPRKLYVETTTRCNMQCGMCVKNAPGSTISNRDLDFLLYRRISGALPTLEALVMNGIGEPLLHPDLVNMVTFARAAMPATSWIGCQTNGLLLERDLAARLFAAGLNRLCISVDGSAGSLPSGRLLHTPGPERSPLALAREVCTAQGLHEVQLGAEIVLVRETISQLPALVSRLIEEGADFILASHLLAYHPEAESQGLFTSATGEAWAIFQRWQQLAQDEGLDLTSLTAKTWIAPGSSREHRLQQLYRAMLAEARYQEIWLDVQQLARWDEQEIALHGGYLAEAAAVAARFGVELSLPPLTASTGRSCRFMEEQAVMIDVEGMVMPCHPLWHSHRLYMDGEPKHLVRRTFGSIAHQDILTIWQSQDYLDFREAARRYDFPFCHSCSLGPCPDISGETLPFVNDCFGTAVPCGHCLWCYDAPRCL